MPQMDLDTLFGLALVGALIVIAIAALLLAVAVVRLAASTGRLTSAAERNLATIESELPPLLAELRTTSANLRRLSEELGPRLERVDTLLDEGEATIAALRATSEAAEEIVRGPVAAVERARRTVSAAGKGLARGADRLRQSVEERATRR